MKLFYRRLYFLTLQRTRVNSYFFFQLSFNITIHAIECAVTTFPVTGASCHR